MIRKLTTADEAAVLEYLYNDPQINIFIIGDIENFGFDVDFQDIYAEFENNRFISVLLRYRTNVIYYSHIEQFNAAWLDIIRAIEPEFISGKKTLVDLIVPNYPSYEVKPMYFAEAKTLDKIYDVDSKTVTRVSNKEEIGLVFDLLITITEFESMKNATREKHIEEHIHYLDHSALMMITENGKCVSTAATVADTKKSAMVVGVATDLSARNKGYASKVMISLMDEYINKRNKSLCLFYDNPKAGKIYHRLGFKDIDMWVMLVRKKD